MMSPRISVASAVPWAVTESLFNAVSGLLSTLVVGFFLKPAEMGEIGAVMAIVSLMEIACAFGIGEAVVRSHSIHTSLTDSAYAGLIALSFVGAALCCALAPVMGWLLDDEGVTALLMAGSVLLPLSAVGIVPVAILTRKMRISMLVKRAMLARTVTLLVSGGLAWLGWGAWAIMISAVIGSAIAGVTLLGAVTRWPRFHLNWLELRALMGLGGLISLETLLVNATTRLFGILFGIFHGVSALGYLQFAQRLTDEIANLIQGSALRFGLSFFSKIERSGGDGLAAFEQGTKLVTIVAAPVLVGFALIFNDGLAVGQELRWMPSSMFVAVAAGSWTLSLPMLLLGPLLRARGVQKPLVIYSIVTCLLTLIGCALTAHSDLLVAAASLGIRHYLAIPISIALVGRFLQLPWRRFVAAFAKPFLSTAIMACSVIGTGSWFARPGERLLAEVGVGVLAYTATILVLDGAFLRSVVGVLPIARLCRRRSATG